MTKEEVDQILEKVIGYKFILLSFYNYPTGKRNEIYSFTDKEASLDELKKYKKNIEIKGVINNTLRYVYSTLSISSDNKVALKIQLEDQRVVYLGVYDDCYYISEQVYQHDNKAPVIIPDAKKEYASGIVSEIRVATILSSENDTLKYPCNVIVHVMERSMNGDVMGYTINTGEGAWVTAKRAKFENMSGIIHDMKYGHMTREDFRNLLKNFNVYQSSKLVKTQHTGIFLD